MGILIVAEIGGRDIAEEVVVGTLLDIGKTSTNLLSRILFCASSGIDDDKLGERLTRGLLWSLKHKGMVRYYQGSDRWDVTAKAVKWAGR